MSDPQVSVIIAVYNGEEHIGELIQSLVDQTIGIDAIEVLAVDDGSTDRTAEVLDGWAERYPSVHVIRRPASGAPGGPRNHGIGIATGEYLFFADADDYLGPEAFERMLGVARRNDSDVILGRIKGVGRNAAPRPFRRGVEAGDVVSTHAVWSLTAHKMFRRSLAIEHGLRFAEGARLAEEQPFILPAYFHAKVISVVADYDCYYLVNREAGQHLTQQPPDADTFFPIVRSSVQTVLANTDPGADQDEMLKRWAWVEISGKFGKRFTTYTPEIQQKYVDYASAILTELIPERIDLKLGIFERLRLALLRRGATAELLKLATFEHSGTRKPAVVEEGRVYAGYPYFRDGKLGIGDAYFDITDEVALDHCRARVTAGERPGTIRVRWTPATPALRDPGVTWSVELRKRGEETRTFPAVPGGDAPEITVDLAEAGLTDGTWGAFTAVTIGATRSALAIGSLGTLSGPPVVHLPEGADRQELGVDHTGRLLVRVGPGFPLVPRVDAGGLTWRSGRLTATIQTRGVLDPAVEAFLYLVRTGTARKEVSVPLTVTGNTLTGTIDLTGTLITPGRWNLVVGPSKGRRVPLRGTKAAGGRPAQRTFVRGKLWSLVWVVAARKHRTLTLVVADFADIRRRVLNRLRSKS